MIAELVVVVTVGAVVAFALNVVVNVVDALALGVIVVVATVVVAGGPQLSRKSWSISLPFSARG